MIKHRTRIDKLDDELCIRLDKGMGANYLTMFDMLSAWQHQTERYKNGEISKEEYDHWRYNYPKLEAEKTKNELDELRKSKGEN